MNDFGISISHVRYQFRIVISAIENSDIMKILNFGVTFGCSPRLNSEIESR